MNFTKKHFRFQCKEKLRMVPGKKKKDRLIIQKLQFLLQTFAIRNLLLFLPLKHEPNIMPLFSNYRGKINIYVPFMQGKSFKLVKYRLPLKKKRFNIKEPPNSFFKTKIDMAIVPVIGVDRDFRRVGFGAGMYDRFFAKLSYRPITVFVQIKKCMTNKSVTDKYDVQGDFLITPNEIIIRGDSYVGRDFSRKWCRDSKWRCRIHSIEKTRKR